MPVTSERACQTAPVFHYNRFRAFYEIDLECHAVRDLAIGIKVRDRRFIGGEEVQR
jgi:hypothetical protein